MLRHILYWAVDEQLLAANPLARMKMARERRTRRQVLSVAEEQASARPRQRPPARHDHRRARYRDAARRNHQPAWEDIDFSQKLLFVTRSKTPEGESREIPSDRAAATSYLLKDRQEEGLVFTYQGQPVRIIKRTWKTALKNAGIRHVRFHDLRHTFNTRLMEAGVLQEIRMALMGHSSAARKFTRLTPTSSFRPSVKPSGSSKPGSDQQQRATENRRNDNASTENDRIRKPPAPGRRPEARKPWKKKSPVEVVLEQADKLKAEIAETEEELKAKRRQLEKFEEAKKLFEGCSRHGAADRRSAQPLAAAAIRRRQKTSPTVYAKFFLPGTGWTWYVTRRRDAGGDDSCSSASVRGSRGEFDFGHFLLSELEAVPRPLGLDSVARPDVHRRQAH